MKIRYVVQLCEKCWWIGSLDRCVRKHKPETDATVFCPQCDEETVTVSMWMSLSELFKGRVF